MTPTTRKLLFTPGPINTTRSVKEAMLVDFGSREDEFVELVQELRQGLLRVVGVAEHGEYHAVPMQGSGTFGVESVIASSLQQSSRLLLIINGSYGRRMQEIAARWRVATECLAFEENQVPDVDLIDRRLAAEHFSHVAVVHCETTSGILNPLAHIGKVVRDHGCLFIVDAISSFGGIPLQMADVGVDFLIASPNKCLQGVPGFSFVIAEKTALQACKSVSRSLSLDLYEQWEQLEATGQFRFTPATHSLVACCQAIRELELEGGVESRHARYRRNHDALTVGMNRLGFQTYVPQEYQSCIVTTYLQPNDPKFSFADVSAQLSEKGMIIYPGKISRTPCFRIGTIGDLVPRDIEHLVREFGNVLKMTGCSLPLSYA